MQSELQRVLELQGEYESRASAAMTERGTLVRQALPSWLREHADPLSEALGVDDFFAKGSDGVGRKARVPWARFGSDFQSPSATTGFYAVYLFDAIGETVYLSLNQGTTDMIGGDLVSKPPGEIIARAEWARAALGPWLAPLADDGNRIDLHDAGLGAGYELGNIACIAYQVNAIPSESSLLADARRFAEGLRMIYEAREVQPIPGEQPEVRQAEELADKASGSTGGPSGAGFRTDAAEVKVIERHAVDVAIAYYEDNGFDVEEFGKPFDLKVTKSGETMTVEVKGTTSDGSGVPLTAGEVAHHAEAFPRNALVVVRNISLHRNRPSPTASGGHLYELRGWDIDPDALRVISYAYEVPRELYDHAGRASHSLSPPGKSADTA